MNEELAVIFLTSYIVTGLVVYGFAYWYVRPTKHVPKFVVKYCPVCMKEIISHRSEITYHIHCIRGKNIKELIQTPRLHDEWDNYSNE